MEKLSADAVKVTTGTVTQRPASGYLIAIDGQSYGPYDMEQLPQIVEQGSLTRETFVWKEGMESWEAAGTIGELSVLF
jgi:hypothetical protein